MTTPVRAVLGIAAAAALALAVIWQSLASRPAAGPAVASAPPDEIAELRARLDGERAARQELEDEVAELRESLRELASAGPSTSAGGAAAEKSSAAGPDSEARRDPGSGPDVGSVGRESPTFDEASVIQAGLPAADAARLRERYEAAQLQELYARDQAVRGGRMRQMGEAVREIDRSLRSDLGEEMYDYLLFGAGEANRVLVEDVFRGSAAESAGVKAGDIIRRYAGQPIYQPRELRRLTTEVKLGEQVPLQIEREGRLLDLSIDAGPIGAPVRPLSMAPRPG